MTAGPAHDEPAVSDTAPLEELGVAVALGALGRGADLATILAEVHARLTHLPPEARVVVACSGGPDSTALALLTAAARPDLRCTLAYVAHGLRGAVQDSEEDALVAALATRIGADHVMRTVEVVRSGGGLESDARDARHAALDALVVERGASAILYGHHADDQAETLLLRLARGSGVDGLGGMAHVSGRRLRPLLRVRRDDLRRVLDDAEGLRTASDPMNDDGDVRRVRVRRAVLPALEGIGPDAVGTLTRLADLARDDAALLEQLVDDAATRLRRAVIGDVHVVEVDGLAVLHVALLRRLLRRLLAHAAGGAPDATSVERLVHAVRGAPSPWRATLPGPVDAEVGHGVLVLVPAPARGDAASSPRPGPHPASDPVALHAPGRAMWEAAGLVLTATPTPGAAPGAGSGATPGATPGAGSERLADLAALVGLDASCFRVGLATAGPFTVRARRDGDRLRTHGGTRTLADVMGEAGVLRALRHRLPVVTDARTDRPLWVPGLVVDVEALPVRGAGAACVLDASLLVDDARHAPPLAGTSDEQH
jgi:tRNA(Ile)-lysidine synthase